MSDYKDIKTIAKEVRQQLMSEFPECKFSVSIQRYSGGQSLSVALTEAPFAAFTSEETHAQLNQFQFRDLGKDYYRGSWESGKGVFRDPNSKSFINNGAALTEQAWDTMQRADQIADKDNWDKSDIQSDYFNVNYYLHLNIGRWDKPFVIASEAKVEAAA